MNRFQATFIHAGLSLLLGLLVLVMMLGFWYPAGYFELLNGTTLLYLILGVDVTLGPLLTLVVFNPAKKSLKFDLAVIVVFQLAALIYGTNIMFQSRPVFTVFEGTVFKVTLASDLIDGKELARAKNPEWKRLSLTGPVLVAAAKPLDPEVQQRMVMAAVAGLDWNMFPSLYIAYDDEQRKLALNNAKPLAQLRHVSAVGAGAVDEFLKSQGGSEKDFVYLPILSHDAAMSAVLDAKTADFIRIIPVDEP